MANSKIERRLCRKKLRITLSFTIRHQHQCGDEPRFSCPKGTQWDPVGLAKTLDYVDRGTYPVDVRARYSVETTPYSRRERDSEIVRLTHLKGMQTYYHIQPYVLTPRITFTVGLYDNPKEYADQEPSIGEVIGSQQEGFDETVIGTSQAYYYHQDRLLVLWEAYLHNHFTVTDHQKKTEDPNLRHLWTSIERFLIGRHPEAERIVTLWDDGAFETEAYRAFLRSLGYQVAESGTYGKQL